MELISIPSNPYIISRDLGKWHTWWISIFSIWDPVSLLVSGQLYSCMLIVRCRKLAFIATYRSQVSRKQTLFRKHGSLHRYTPLVKMVLVLACKPSPSRPHPYSPQKWIGGPGISSDNVYDGLSINHLENVGFNDLHNCLSLLILFISHD